MSAATDDPTGIPIPTDRTYLSHGQVEELKEDVTSMERSLADPSSQFSDRGGVIRQLQQLQKDLTTGEPPDTTSEQRDALSREERELLSEIKPAMPSQAEMRRRPPGAVGKHRTFEKAFKSRIIRWKNIRRILNKGNDDPDISNLEMHRGTNSTLNMDNAFIPGKDYFIPPATQAYRDGHDRAFGSKDTPADPGEVQSLLARLSELEKQVAKRPAAEAKAPRKPSVPHDARCGSTFKSLAGAMAHERSCSKCATATEQSEAKA